MHRGFGFHSGFIRISSGLRSCHVFGALDSATGIGPTPSFATQQTFATGTLPQSVTVADVNGDGKPDLDVPSAI
ncbi:FG-GAP repeat domain-containing protein [Dokdonella soli]|uniref:FG-GAP repeat domain-containing protein n=1 Tax=Dokdonella soli TaxID=529810 RepID=UPI003622CE12